MSQNLDTIRLWADVFNAFMRGELSSEAYADGFDPQIELLWRDRQTYPDFPQHLRGLPKCIAFSQQYRDGWIDLVQQPLELIEAPGGRVLALVRQSGRGRQSGVPIVIDFFELLTIRDGKMRKIEYFRHRADAARAAGLEEYAISENLDLVRSIFAAWERGDYSSSAWAHPEIKCVFADGPEPGRWTGRSGMAGGARGIIDAWEGLRTEVDEYRELDDECVLVLVRRRGRGKTSGMELGQLGSEGANVFHVRDRKVMRFVGYWDRDRALADLGLADG